MAPQIIEIEPEIKTFLVANAITDPIKLQDFGRDTALPAFVIRREGKGPTPEQITIDLARVIITARAISPQTSFAKIKSVIDLIDRFGPGTMGTADILHAELSEGPFRDDDDAGRIFQNTAIFFLRVKVK